jgi:hypothetical protein
MAGKKLSFIMIFTLLFVSCFLSYPAFSPFNTDGYLTLRIPPSHILYWLLFSAAAVAAIARLVRYPKPYMQNIAIILSLLVAYNLPAIMENPLQHPYYGYYYVFEDMRANRSGCVKENLFNKGVCVVVRSNCGPSAPVGAINCYIVKLHDSQLTAGKAIESAQEAELLEICCNTNLGNVTSVRQLYGEYLLVVAEESIPLAW